MLEINHMDVYYGDLQSLWDVSIAVVDGKIVTLVGSNGAGKSTIMKAITGLLKPRTGKIVFNKINIERLPPHNIVEMGICLVPEGRRLFSGMSVLENLEVGASPKSARKTRDKNLDWVYEIFPILKERVKQAAGTLSGGEQQMLAIGRALMSEPSLLLIDEMSLGLSPIVVQELSRVIKEINQLKKLTILLVEQDVQLALTLSDTGYVIENGRIVGHGDSRELLNSDQVKEAYLGC
ncbi:MAG: branched-chain amino acid ABC transporter ATP-binding protein [Chloroflexi bacterium RBG_16_50_9]|nr:MAG: branched-chain amino acid ABC transporter ATP-binding protein [Chloroflexi bacterium RBG_16_50_9]